MNTYKTLTSHVVELPIISNDGSLIFAEVNKHIPFDIKRFYYIFDVSEDAIRGMHAHKQTTQILFCIKGRIKMVLDNGREKEEIVLDKPNKGIYLDKMLWHEMKEFKKDTILLVMASDYYFEQDYIRKYDNFLTILDQPVIKYRQLVKWVEESKRALNWIRVVLNRDIHWR